ncbi:MAG TPA: PEP-CTERM sorting domain-containing protein [Burkholderiaceae bacterium]|nr:PEP-CTERM sorting domain-containing protein [Burkholderiaceae bacterium]
MKASKFYSSLAIGTFSYLMLASTATAAPIVFDRGLPDVNINNAAGASRSNVSWNHGSNVIGDNFSVGVAGQQYRIDTLTVWGAQYDPLSLDVSNISLYLGKEGGALSQASTGAVTGNSNSNPNITHTVVSYPDGTAFYEGNGGFHYSVIETTFSGLDWLIDGGVLYDFGVFGDDFGWFSHASNAALSGTRQDGADDRYLSFDPTDWTMTVLNSDRNSGGSGWDKSSDINVRITAAQVPEPTTLALVGLALAGLGFVRRKSA